MPDAAPAARARDSHTGKPAGTWQRRAKRCESRASLRLSTNAVAGSRSPSRAAQTCGATAPIAGVSYEQLRQGLLSASTPPRASPSALSARAVQPQTHDEAAPRSPRKLLGHSRAATRALKPPRRAGVKAPARPKGPSNMAESTAATVERTILKANAQGTGFLTTEEPGKWFNLSRFASPAPAIPLAGTTARITVDGKGFVRKVEPIASATTAQNAPEAPRTPVPPTTAIEVRLALLQAAAAFLAPRSEAKTTDVVTVAEVWESWINSWRAQPT